MNVTNLLSILKLANIILSIAYFVGFFFVIVSEISTMLNKAALGPLTVLDADEEFEIWYSERNFVTFYEKYDLWQDEDD